MRRRLERDMDDEMRLHLELEADELVRSGLAPDEAGRQARVTAEFFRTVGVRAAVGRVFVPDDTLPSRPPIVVLSDAMWRGRFGGDPAVIGRSMASMGPRTWW